MTDKPETTLHNRPTESGTATLRQLQPQHRDLRNDEAQETSPGLLTEIPHPWAAPTVASVGLARWRCAGFGCVRGGRVVGRNRRRV